MKVRFQTFEQFHNKHDVGSTKIRVHNLIKYWPEAELYKYGEDIDVMIFQKVYVTQDYKFHKRFRGIRILDICDPDWLEGALIKETVDAVDAVVAPTEATCEFIQQLTDKPVVQIKDRFDLTEFPTEHKQHKGEAKDLVWFGYAHNADTLKFAIPTLDRMGLNLTIISDRDPNVERWAKDEYKKPFKDRVKYIKYDPETIYEDLTKFDICFLPKGYRPVDKYKSENKYKISTLCGTPVAQEKYILNAMMDGEFRAQWMVEELDRCKRQYDCKKSVEQYKELINEIADRKNKV